MSWDNFKVGFLDNMFDVFDNHNHPIVLIGQQATLWMGVMVCTCLVRYFVSKFFDSFSTGLGL
jgi:hypothetical protein